MSFIESFTRKTVSPLIIFILSSFARWIFYPLFDHFNGSIPHKEEHKFNKVPYSRLATVVEFVRDEVPRTRASGLNSGSCSASATLTNNYS